MKTLPEVPRPLKEFVRSVLPAVRPNERPKFVATLLSFGLTAGRKSMSRLHQQPELFRCARQRLSNGMASATLPLDKCLLRGAVAFERDLALPRGSRIEIVLDGTTVEKRGKQMDGLAWLWSNAKKEIVWGHHFVLAVVRFGPWTIPFAIRLRLPEEFFKTAEGKASGRKYETTLAIAEAILRQVPDRWRRRYEIAVVADTEFFGGQFPKVCRRLGFTLVSACQRNRSFRPDTQPNTRKALSGYAYGVHYWNERNVRIDLGHTIRRFRVAERTGTMKRAGRVKIVPSCRVDGGAIKTLVSTDPRLPMREIVFLYAERWWIEVTIKQLKSFLGLGEYQCLDWRAIEHHAQFSCLAHLQLTFLAAHEARKEGLTPTEGVKLPSISDLQRHLHDIRVRERLSRAMTAIEEPKVRHRIYATTGRPTLRFTFIQRVRPRRPPALRKAA